MELGRVAQHDERFLDYQRRSRNLGSMYNVNASSKKKTYRTEQRAGPAAVRSDPGHQIHTLATGNSVLHAMSASRKKVTLVDKFEELFFVRGRNAKA